MTVTINNRGTGTWVNGDGSVTGASIAGGGKLVGIGININDAAAPGNLSSFTNSGWTSNPNWSGFKTQQFNSGGAQYSVGVAFADTYTANAGAGSIDNNWSGSPAVGWATLYEVDSDASEFSLFVTFATGTGTAVTLALWGGPDAAIGCVVYGLTQTTVAWNNSYTEVGEFPDTLDNVVEASPGHKIQANTDDISITLGTSNTWVVAGIHVFEGPLPPLVATSATTTDSSGAATTINMPSGITAGDLLLILGGQDSPTGADVALGGDWTKIRGQNAVGASVASGNIWAKIAAGSDTASATSGSTGSAGYIAIRVPVGNHGVTDVSTDILKTTAATGTSAGPDPGNLSGLDSTKNYLILETFVADDDDNTATYWTSGYDPIAQVETATSGTPAMLAMAQKLVFGITAENPGAMAMAASEEWVAWTLAIPEAVVSSALQKDTSITWDVLDQRDKPSNVIWDVLDSRQKDTAVSWDVLIVAGTKSAAVSWDVLDQRQADNSVTWDLRDQRTRDDPIVWDVLDTRQRDDAVSWDVLDQRQVDSSVVWDVLDQRQKDSAVVWDVLEQRELPVLISWDVESGSALTKDVQITWDILDQVQKDSSITWDVHDRRQADSAVSWDVLDDLTKTTSVSWDVLQRRQKDSTVTWDVRDTRQADYSVSWDIHDTQQKDVSVSWDVLDQRQVSNSISWDVRDERQASFLITWDVEGEGEEETGEFQSIQMGKPSIRAGAFGRTVTVH